MPDRLVLSDAVVVTPDAVLPGGSVVVEDGLIIDVQPHPYPAGDDVIDLGGQYLLPGLIDLHNDAVEVAVNPRPGADFPLDFSLLQLDRSLAAAGVTTQFHAIYFSDDFARRSIDRAGALCTAIDAMRETGDGTIDHHAMLRVDLRSSRAMDVLLAALEVTPIPLVSLNDHVPGQGQFRDLDAYRRYLARYGGKDRAPDEVEAMIEDEFRRVVETEPIVTATLGRLVSERFRRDLILVSHDDDSPERVDQMYDLGCRIAEFPLTVEAAERARQHGMEVAMGSPNAFRGGSLSGNASALELLACDLVTIMVADYHAPTLLAALFRAVDFGLCDLAKATRLVTRSPALAVGLTDRGAIAPGLRADLIVVEQRQASPLVTAAMTQGRWHYASGAMLAEGLVSTQSSAGFVPHPASPREGIRPTAVAW